VEAGRRIPAMHENAFTVTSFTLFSLSEGALEVELESESGSKFEVEIVVVVDKGGTGNECINRDRPH
jgi:hypothetical protein